ncbi:MAG: hypothetical protein WA892_07535 [Ornithinimicrobium sp.]
MIAIVTVLVAFPLGYFVRSRLAANSAYALVYLWAIPPHRKTPDYPWIRSVRTPSLTWTPPPLALRYRRRCS